MNRLTLSRIKSTLYRKPKDELARMSRWGMQAYFQCDAWAGEMEASVERLNPPAFDPSLSPIETWFLTGQRFWYQTAYCAWTLSAQANREVAVNIVDDGTLTEEQESSLRRLFPKGTILRSAGIEDSLNERLPRESFPVLRARCDDYINIRKLVDVHLGSEGWKLVLDSDMLFFDRPDEIIRWWDRANAPGEEAPILLMRDCEESYGYSREVMTALTGAEIPPLLNVGVCGLKSEAIDWEEVENWCATLSEKEGTSYFLEQALVAMMASRQSHLVLPSDNYLTFPNREATIKGLGTLQHYVADSKPWYFGHAWKNAILAATNRRPLELAS